MEIGGRGSLASFRRPLAEVESQDDTDLEAQGFGDGPYSRRSQAASPRGRDRASGSGSGGGFKSASQMLKDSLQAVSTSRRTGSPGSSRHMQSVPDAAAAAAAVASIAAAGRRLLPSSTAAAALLRASTPLRAAAEARKSLQRSLKAEGECFAICMAGGLDLVGIAAASMAHIEGESGVPIFATASSSSQGEASHSSAVKDAVGLPKLLQGEERSLAGLGGAQLIKHFGTGENIVLQLKMFKGKDVFAFGFGCIVCWSFESSQMAKVIDKLRPFLIRPLPKSDVEEESMEFVISQRSEDDNDEDMEQDDDDQEGREGEEGTMIAKIKNDQIILCTSSDMEKLAHSYALAQSVRLGSFELVVDRSIASTRSIPETMADTGEIQLEARDLSKQMGGLLVLRCDVNLHTDILDTPDIFWDEDRFEPNYQSCRSYLDIDKRVDILNQRLGVLKDLYDLLQNSLNVKHGTKLEWIVIILILVEVMLEVIELVHDAGSN